MVVLRLPEVLVASCGVYRVVHWPECMQVCTGDLGHGRPEVTVRLRPHVLPVPGFARAVVPVPTSVALGVGPLHVEQHHVVRVCRVLVHMPEVIPNRVVANYGVIADYFVQFLVQLVPIQSLGAIVVILERIRIHPTPVVLQGAVRWRCVEHQCCNRQGNLPIIHICGRGVPKITHTSR